MADGYVFHCTPCGKAHAGECPPRVRVSIDLDTEAPRKARDFLSEIQSLVKALEAGSYNAAPSTLHQCKRDIRDCDICTPPGTIFYDDIRVKGDGISLSYSYKCFPISFIPITFSISGVVDPNLK